MNDIQRSHNVKVILYAPHGLISSADQILIKCCCRSDELEISHLTPTRAMF